MKNPVPAKRCFHHYCFCQEARSCLTEDDFERGLEKRQTDEMREQYIKEKGYGIVEI